MRKCPHCGGKVERLIAAPAIQFKGAGWYVTDYAKKTSGSDSEKPAADSKDATIKEGKDKDSTPKETATKESKEKKPVKRSK